MMSIEIHTLKEPLRLYREAKPIEYSTNSATGCWNVISHALNDKGYTKVMRNRRVIRVHRYSYELTSGPIPDGFFVCHRCDNPTCINPEHLFLGTNKDNMRDAARKGRTIHGKAHRSSKLTEADVKAIRANKISSQSDLGRKYGVCQSQISCIKNGKTWNHVTCPSGASA